jgi:glycosyltransferase involved in cell wall biosynthesis
MIEAQGLPPVACDVVIVDDKSTDESVKIMRRFVDPSSVWGGKACAECARPPPQYTIIEHKKNRGAGISLTRD